MIPLNYITLKKLSIDKIRGYVEQKRRDSNISGQSSGVFSSCQGNLGSHHLVLLNCFIIRPVKTVVFWQKSCFS